MQIKCPAQSSLTINGSYYCRFLPSWTVYSHIRTTSQRLAHIGRSYKYLSNEWTSDISTIQVALRLNAFRVRPWGQEKMIDKTASDSPPVLNYNSQHAVKLRSCGASGKRSLRLAIGSAGEAY